MRTSFFTATLATVAGVSGIALPQEPVVSVSSSSTIPSSSSSASSSVKSGPTPVPSGTYANQPKMIIPVPLEVAAAKFKNATGQVLDEVKQVIGEVKDLKDVVKDSALHARGNCGNVRVRQEWDGMSHDDRMNFINAIKCLQNKGSAFSGSASRNRYEDFVMVHQSVTPNVHGNRKFMIWHRYFLWAFEDILRTECGFNTAFPWWDETRYAGAFSQANSVWYYFGTPNSGNGCVNDGQFAGVGLNIGPGSSNQQNRCLQRRTNDESSVNTGTAYFNQCKAWGDYANMASCFETGPHAWGHNSIGGVMSDMFSSPEDPVFWLHHAYVDRGYRIWQNEHGGGREINGQDVRGNDLTLDTNVNIWGLRDDIRIRSIIDTTDTRLCYRYNY